VARSIGLKSGKASPFFFFDQTINEAMVSKKRKKSDQAMDAMAFMARVDLSWIHVGCPRIEQTASGFEDINFPFPKLFRPHLHAYDCTAF
jgi:hypothetical protein